MGRDGHAIFLKADPELAILGTSELLQSLCLYLSMYLSLRPYPLHCTLTLLFPPPPPPRFTLWLSAFLHSTLSSLLSSLSLPLPLSLHLSLLVHASFQKRASYVRRNQMWPCTQLDLKTRRTIYTIVPSYTEERPSQTHLKIRCLWLYPAADVSATVFPEIRITSCAIERHTTHKHW